MSKVDTDKKLELIRTIRMQNQYNRQLCRSREQLIYSDDVTFRKGEIYGLESATMSMSDKFTGKPVMRTDAGKEPENESILKGFRIRMVVAMILFLAFVFCDIKEIAIGGEMPETLFERMTETTLPDFTDGMNLEKPL